MFGYEQYSRTVPTPVAGTNCALELFAEFSGAECGDNNGNQDGFIYLSTVAAGINCRDFSADITFNFFAFPLAAKNSGRFIFDTTDTETEKCIYIRAADKLIKADDFSEQGEFSAILEKHLNSIGLTYADFYGLVSNYLSEIAPDYVDTLKAQAEKDYISYYGNKD